MRITIQNIAEIAGVHPSTVSRALNGHPRLPDARRKEILSIAESLGYRPNLMAKALLGKQTNTIGIIAPRLTNLHAVSLINAEEAELREKGFVAILSITNLNEETELRAIQDLTDRYVDGLIVNYSPQSQLVNTKLKELAQNELPISMIGGRSEVFFDEVDVDFNKWTFNLVDHLIEMGHRRIAIILDETGIDSGSYKNTKHAGYKRAIEENNLEYKPEFVFRAHDIQQDVKLLMQKIMSLKDRATAIFAYSDDLASELIKVLVTAGYKVPHDVSVVGFSDNWYADRLLIPLTTCKLPADEIGRTATELLIARINDNTIKPQRKILECEIKHRSSVCRIQGLKLVSAQCKEPLMNTNRDESVRITK